jgi:hypothetical protein
VISLIDPLSQEWVPFAGPGCEKANPLGGERNNQQQEGYAVDQKIQAIGSKTERSVEIVVHVSEDLNESQRDDLVSALRTGKGIAGAEFCPLRFHLMLVRYDRDLISSQDVLASVKSHKYNARLIGPI